MSKHYLEYHDPAQNSHKFYEVWVEGSITKARYGRVGKHGQTKDYPNSSPGDAELRRDELVAEKKRKGYQPATKFFSTNAPQTPVQPVSNGYRLFWKAASPIGPSVLAHAVQESHEILRAVQARVGGAEWKLEVTEGVGGDAYTFSYGKATERRFSFGFMPKGQYDALKPSTQKSHSWEGISGWLSPDGISPNGGVVRTDGDYVDLAARLLLVLLRGAVPDFTVVCDLDLPYGRRTLTAIPDEQTPKFAWTRHWATIAEVLAEQGMVGGSAGMNAHLRKLSQQSSDPFVF